MHWVGYYHQVASGAGITLPSVEQTIRDFDFMGLQRHIKVAGIFCRLFHRDGKAAYLKDIPLTLGYIAEVVAIYPELASYHEWFVQRLKPELEKINMMWRRFS